MRSDEIDIVVDEALAAEPIYTISISSVRGSLTIMGEFEFANRTITVRGMHIGGDPEVAWTWTELRAIAGAVAEKLDVDVITVHGATRTTGANPGRRPRVVRFTRPLQPDAEAESKSSQRLGRHDPEASAGEGSL